MDIERDGWIKDNLLSYVVDNKLIKRSIAKPLIERLSKEFVDQYKGELKESANFLLQSKLPEEIYQLQKEHDAVFKKYEEAREEVEKLERQKPDISEQCKDAKRSDAKKKLTEEKSQTHGNQREVLWERFRFQISLHWLLAAWDTPTANRQWAIPTNRLYEIQKL